MSIFTASFAAVAVSAAQDVFEIVAPSDSRVRIRDCVIGQYSDVGDAAAEILSVRVIRGFTTGGSGGATVTPANLRPWSRTAGAAVERNNTTVAQDGTGVDLVAATFNVAAGWALRDVLRGGRLGPVLDDDEFIYLEASGRLVVRITAPADAVTMNGTLVFEEIGTFVSA